MDSEQTQEQLREAYKAYNRRKQKEFYDTMVAGGYRRRHNWFSKRSVELLDELSDGSYSKEIVLEEALEILALVKKKWPDSRFADALTLEKMQAYALATPRGHELHFKDAMRIIKKRLKMVKDLLKG